MTPTMKILAGAAVSGVMAVVASGSAFTAGGITQPGAGDNGVHLGWKSATVSGVVIQSMNYTLDPLDPTLLASIDYVITENTSLSLVSIIIDEGGTPSSPITCSTTWTATSAVHCVATTAVADVDSVALTVH